MKALETLKKTSTTQDSRSRSSLDSNKENNRESCLSENYLGKFTDMLLNNYYLIKIGVNVPARMRDAINISELFAEKTIYMDNSSCSKTLGTKENKMSFSSEMMPPPNTRYEKYPTKVSRKISSEMVSFEPSEITGRSTMNRYEKYNKSMNSSKISAENLSVGEILSKSRLENVRNLSESISEIDDLNKTISSLSLSSLPRTADMSKLSSNNESCYNSEEFTPAEKMQSKLMMDELSWAKEYADIPSTSNSSEQKDEAQRDFEEDNISKASINLK